uniref:Uncharacterized protein n=1 Tax=Cucumis melo TaxID=3656 RepID=A0A9I9CY05_CUCME
MDMQGPKITINGSLDSSNRIDNGKNGGFNNFSNDYSGSGGDGVCSGGSRSWRQKLAAEVVAKARLVQN